MINEQVQDILTRTTAKKISGENLHEQLQNGIVILIDKPQTWTSFDVVNKIKKTFQVKRVGHAGTLDPMATGLLIVCTGRMTKTVNSFVTLDKTYLGTLKLGEMTESYDSETKVTERRSYEHVTEEMIHRTVSQFLGVINQVPPMYSAVKKNGTPLYKLARKGIRVTREARTVEIHEFVVTNVSLPYVSFRVRCSKGTYIRSLAHSLGVKLESGAHLTELRRIAIGTYNVSDALSIENMMELKEHAYRSYQ